MKKQSNLGRLLSYAGNRKILSYLSWFFAAVSALIALVPFWYIWRILKEVIEVAPNFGEAVNITHYGWMAVLFAVAAVLVYITGLMCSHMAAFRIATNMRIEMTEHISKLPLGVIEQFGSGKLRRTISETTGATEAYLAHQLPDKAKAIANIVGMLALLAVFDWRLGLLSLAPVLLAFICMSGMTGKNMQRKMTEYQNALADMSNEAVEYVRGIPVVKTFGQTVFSFKKFKGTIDNYEKWTTSYTLDLRGPMMLYTLAINSVFAFLIVGAFWFSHGTVTPELLLDVLFYIIITPVITLTMTSLMYMSENNMIVADAIDRVDSVLDLSELSTSDDVQHPADGSVELENVSFSYDGSKNAVDNVSLKIAEGQTVAFVGPSGGGKSTLASIIARFFDPQSGSVRIGGADVKQIPKDELMNTVSFVFQNSRLIKGSILDNVRLSNPAAREAEVMAALKAAQCMDIIEKFPQGVNTVIGSEGIYLSGGEMQRFCIARALAPETQFIIADEISTMLDVITQAQVWNLLLKVLNERKIGLIAITHSPELAERVCDRVIDFNTINNV